MTPIEKDDFIAWRDHPVTQGFLQATLEEMNESVKDLIVGAGLNSLGDRYNCGKIQGLSWLVDWQPTFDEKEEEETE